MHKFTEKRLHSKAAVLTIIFGLITLLHFQGCTDSGSVGGSLPGSNTDLQVDTVLISELETDTLVAFSGSQSFFSAGQFQDPLFGDLEATGLIQPALPARNEDLTFGDSTRMQLRFVINREAVYGDTLAGADFSLIELREIFRGNAFQIDDEAEIPQLGDGPVMITPVGSFTVENEDSIDVELSETWVRRYGSFYNSEEFDRDSSYVREFFGLAVVPRNQAKIVAFNPVDSRFIATDLTVSANADSTIDDSLSINSREWAYMLNRANIQAAEAGSSQILSTLERVIFFNFDFSSENLDARNISRVELVFPRNNVPLQQSISQPGVVRPLGTTLNLHMVDGDELPQSIDPGNPIAAGQYLPEEEAYRINLTQNFFNRQFENTPADQRFYLTLGFNNGAIRTSLLFNDQAGAENQPKVIVTSINTESN